MKKLKMLCVAFIAMLFSTMGANAVSLSFSENSSNGNITVSPYSSGLKYQWVHVDYQAYQAVEAKLKGIVAEIKEMHDGPLEEARVKANTARQKHSDANAKLKAEQAKDPNSNATKMARQEAAKAYAEYETAKAAYDEEENKYNAKYAEFMNEVAKIAPINESAWKDMTSGTVAFDPTGYTQADAAVIWVKTSSGNETKIYMYQQGADGGFLRAEVDCPVVRKFCEVDGNTYYGKDGNQVTKEEYEDQCLPKICKVVDNKYYGLSGTEVDEKTYNEECGPKVCVFDNGKYYDKEGKEVSKEEYNKQCNPTCKVEDGKYYGPEGEELTKEEYEELCTKNPKTGFGLPLTLGIILLGGGAAGIMVANKKKLFKQI